LYHSYLLCFLSILTRSSIPVCIMYFYPQPTFLPSLLFVPPHTHLSPHYPSKDNNLRFPFVLAGVFSEYDRTECLFNCTSTRLLNLQTYSTLKSVVLWPVTSQLMSLLN
jgi:hypothetical protein